jgi:hypothetical protein
MIFESCLGIGLKHHFAKYWESFIPWQMLKIIVHLFYLKITYLLDIKRMRLNIFVWALYRMGAIETEIYFVSCSSSINLNRRWKK